MGTRPPRPDDAALATAAAARGAAGSARADLLSPRLWTGFWRTALASLLLAAGVAQSQPAQLEPLSHFPSTTLTVESSGRVHRFNAWVADTEPRHEQGLMFVKALPPNQGMLFLFQAPQPTAFWMKNTLIPLDMLFIAPDGRIVRIAERTEPLSLKQVDSMGIILGVLELDGGTAERLKIHTGDRVRHPAFGAR
jgi:uncharacterized membrane protein (UPF0127 family)